MSETIPHTHAIHYGEELKEAWQRNTALFGFIADLNKSNWAPVPFTKSGDVETPEDQPVITGRFLTAELMLARKHGLTFKTIEEPAPSV